MGDIKKFIKIFIRLILIKLSDIIYIFIIIGIIKKSHLTNAPKYLNISTYDGSGQSVHPDVIYTPISWYGYHYLLTYTPYPYENDDFENPSIRGSNDGINWYKFEGQPDPIIQPPSDVGSGGHNADPNIVLVGSELNLFYFKTDDTADGSKIYFATSTNPAIWTTHVQTDLPAILSPSFHYNGSTWECWGVDFNSLLLRHFTSLNKINWTEHGKVSCTIPGYCLWHMNVKKYSNAYLALAVGYKDILGHRAVYSLFSLKSDDGIKWTLMDKNPILIPSRSGWDNNRIYASTLIDDGLKYRIWYSAQSKKNEWHIGYIEQKHNEIMSKH